MWTDRHETKSWRDDFVCLAKSNNNEKEQKIVTFRYFLNAFVCFIQHLLSIIIRLSIKLYTSKM